MLNSSKHIPQRTGIWLAMVVVVVIAGWRLWVIASQRHLLAVAEEIGSIAQFKEVMTVEELVPSSEGHGLVFFQETETGLGTYFWNAASDQIKLLFEQKENGYAGEFGFVTWSPEDHFFACAFKSNSDQQPMRKFVIYDGVSGEPLTTIEALWDAKFIWLSPHSFAYSRYNQAWLVVRQNADGKWTQSQIVNRFGDGELNGLTATSSHSVAWQQGGALWTFDLTTGTSEKLWESTTNKLESFNYSNDTGNFVLNCSDENRPLSILLHPRRLWDKQGTTLDATRSDTRSRYADLRIDHGQYSFTIKTGTNTEPIHFVWDGMVEYYKLAGDCLYFTGNPPNTPPGIWQYDINSKTARCLASGLKGKFKSTQMVTPLVGTGKNTTGKDMSYHLWEPTHVSVGKKYPLIIGQAHYMWFSYPQVAANGGYYFAAADRVSWWDGLDDWGADVMALYEILAKNPNIDTNRVCLFATSAESSLLARFVVEKPDFWSGVILFNPVAEPELSHTHLARMFIISGRDDDNNTIEQLTKYQDAAAKAGLPIKLLIQDGVQHITRSIATERERTRQFARFLLEN